jgi:hypothetical protein
MATVESSRPNFKSGHCRSQIQPSPQNRPAPRRCHCTGPAGGLTALTSPKRPGTPTPWGDIWGWPRGRGRAGLSAVGNHTRDANTALLRRFRSLSGGALGRSRGRTLILPKFRDYQSGFRGPGCCHTPSGLPLTGPGLTPVWPGRCFDWGGPPSRCAP